MQIKRFEAKSIREALQQVRETMGPEALILSTKPVKKSSFPFELSRRSSIEVIAAIDRPAETPPLRPPSPVSLSKPRDEEGKGGAEEDAIIQKVLSTGLCPEVVHGVVKEIQASRKELSGWTLAETYRGLLRWKLMEKVEVTGPSFDGPQIWSFIGPTGVGKTTTLVKLAAHFRLRASKKVSLISIDTYRVGAVEQLKAYSQILGVPLEIALNREDLKQAIEKNRHQDFVLIDTAGRSPKHKSQLEELKDFLTIHPHIENHLVLSATTKDEDLEQAADRFGILPIRSCIFSKIDETDEYAPMLNQLVRHGRPLSYLTCGQRVPEDIELATKAKVANLVLDQIQWN